MIARARAAETARVTDREGNGVGAMAQACQEQARMRPRRYIHPVDGEDGGPDQRK